jgi:hypothetical protein
MEILQATLAELAKASPWTPGCPIELSFGSSSQTAGWAIFFEEPCCDDAGWSELVELTSE